MSTDRVNELREILRAHRPDTTNIDQPVRDAVARQDAALRSYQEPANVIEDSLGEVLDVEAGLDDLFRRLGPPADHDDEK